MHKKGGCKHSNIEFIPISFISKEQQDQKKKVLWSFELMVYRRMIRLMDRHAEHLPVTVPGSGKVSSMKGDLHKCHISLIPITSKIRSMRSGGYWRLSSFRTILNLCMGDSLHALIELPSCHWSVGY